MPPTELAVHGGPGGNVVAAAEVVVGAAVVGAEVVGAGVVGAEVVGAAVVGAEVVGAGGMQHLTAAANG